MSAAEAAQPEQMMVIDDDGPDPERGLSAAQVQARIAAGLVNTAPPGTTRSTGQIVFANVFNPVNAIMLSLFALILVAGYPADGLFVGVVASNSIIGIVQELYARRELHRLELLNAPIATIVRDGERIEVTVEEIVVDDLVVLMPGEQIVVDAMVIDAVGLEADESLLTGEADPIDKAPGDEVLSGSFVNAGSGTCRATRVGAASYANSLAAEAKRFELVHSELRRGINVVLRALVVLIPPSGLLLLLSLLDVEERWQDALQGTVAAAVAMVPDGLVLLTSLTFVAGVIALARRQALAKELATVELLARVDTLCLDKTGTITTGEISYGSAVPLGDHSDADVAEALSALAASDPNPNPTMAAVATAHASPPGWDVVTTEPFSSARKWSATEFAGRGTYYFGAPDILLDEDDLAARAQVTREAEQGRRVLLVTRSDAPLTDELPAQRHPVAMVLLEDTVRPDAPEILAYFTEQGVDLKVISGDNVATVAAVAAKAGIPGADASIDARELPDDPEALADALEHITVFGRVTPHQKRAMVGALQAKGRVVAMTGDGVNDVLALKDADMGIAMGSGSSASRGVAQLVLLDNRFATLPEVLAQGRRVINNIERVANLFVTKAVYAVLLTAIIGIQQVEFPFLPRQLTLIGTFSIGLPGAFLALAPNVNLVRPGFLQRVLRFSIPAGLVAGIATWSVYQYARDGALAGQISDADLADARSAATITLLGIGLVVLVVVSRPLRLWKIGLAATMAAMYALVLAWDFPREYFELTIPDGNVWLVCGGAVAAAAATIIAIPLVVPGLRMAERIRTTG
ncbi:MAG: HAD-IC family P-type ATPase [Acidimicrobiales bacterium]